MLCPSFYSAQTIYNPSLVDRWLHRWRAGVIDWLETRRQRGRVRLGPVEA